MDCPFCGLTNPADAQICDCGYNFQTHLRGKATQPIPTSGPLLADIVILPNGSELTLASHRSRWFGQALDGGIALVLALITLLVIHYLRIGENAEPYICLSVYLGYFLFADGFKGGQSLGKIFQKTAVVNSSDGEPCSYFQSFLRNICQILGILDWIFIFGKKRQRLGDMAARTLVVRTTSA